MSSRAIKLMVIDDNKTVVDGIMKQIAWQNHGIILSGSAKNGLEGLEKIQESEPDIVITDIRMPKLNGLEMVAKALEQSPSLKVILLTGYSDFENAQRAVKLGAFDFITKPFTFKQIEEVVLKAKDEVTLARESDQKLQELEFKVREGLPALRQEYMNYLMRYSVKQEAVQERWNFLGIDLRLSELVVMVVEIDQFKQFIRENSSYNVELLRFSVLNVLEETVNAAHVGITCKSQQMQQFIIVINVQNKEQTRKLAEACRVNIETYVKYCTVSIGVGAPADRVENLPGSYQSALLALQRNFYVDGNSVFFEEDGGTPGAAVPIIPEETEQDLLLSIRSGNEAKAQASLRDIYDYITDLRSRPEPEYIYHLYLDLSFMILRILSERFASDDLQKLQERYLDRLLQAQESHRELYELMQKFCSRACRMIEDSQHADVHQAIYTAIEMMRNNLHRNITVNECANYVYLSSSYFASLFKKVTGVPYYQFLTRERMEKAKKLLLEDYQIKEISTLVGYDDRRYFSKAFKKHTGLTPSEFKNKYISEE